MSPAVVERTRHALRVGALDPIPTELRFVEDGGFRFLVRIASQVTRKQAASTYTGNRSNPFLPYDQDLFVAEVSGTHVALLNKFPVVEHHVLLVTRQFEDQESPLTAADFEAIWACMADHDSLAFYNSGAIAGASQRHKHLQVVPLPLVPGGPRLPLEPRIFEGTDPALPFPHVLARAETDATLETYRAMLAAVGLDARRPAPYNLLATSEWMLLVPRSRERFHTISLNALAFAGSLFVRDETELALLRRAGPMSVLASVAGRS